MTIRSLRKLASKAYNTAAALSDSNTCVLNWATEARVSQNWGDKLNPYLANRLSGKRVLHRKDVFSYPGLNVHYFIGSHLASACSHANSVVWGAGFISEDVAINGTPKEIRAVRGWLSRDRLRDAGIDCPEVVGDPALLLPQFYTPRPALARYQLGIIPHYAEWDEPFFRSARAWGQTLLIDICGSITDVVDQITSCDFIVSSSLHGIICADSYGVPSLWIRASDRPKGDGFKFRDYFSSVGRKDRDPIAVSAGTPRVAIVERRIEYTIQIELEKLLAACPLTS